ncbi:hypothetical protein FHY55_08825 [Oceanicola sp. D3]|uniref:ion channel n=1 Tax=Oceanicola sp. D3 TaxID=2587163 RepID=UPI0011235D1A|nr:ion channel [Oceanicola sp. D3]QDC09339.1 hypothetical protein FHY55_08825 [Oceanicola sp. D3]
MRKSSDDFFTLKEPYDEINQSKDFWKAVERDETEDIRDLLYRPNKLESIEPPKKWRLRNKNFHNVSFAKTLISQIEFTDCKFSNCLFTGSVISNCRFNNCQFELCNFYRTEIRSTFVDPRSFSKCLNPKEHANIGVGLYHELLHNSRQQAQPDFSSYSQYQFMKWQRYLRQDEITKSNTGLWMRIYRRATIFPAWIFEITTGSGTRLSNLALTSSLMLFAITVLNYYFRTELGLELSGQTITSITESFYFSTIVVTSLGFGDITPSTGLGRLVIACEAISGFLTFALLVSMAFRKITS